MLKDIFDFTEHHEKSTYGLGYKLTLTRKKVDAVIDKIAGIADAKNKIDHIHRYVPQYTPSIQQQGILSKQSSCKTPTELRYIERSVFVKKFFNRSHRNFELGSQESMNVPVWIIIGFQQRNRQNYQNLNNDSFFWLPGTSAKGVIGTENHPDSGILLNYDDGDHCRGYG